MCLVAVRQGGEILQQTSSSITPGKSHTISISVDTCYSLETPPVVNLNSGEVLAPVADRAEELAKNYLGLLSVTPKHHLATPVTEPLFDARSTRIPAFSASMVLFRFGRHCNFWWMNDLFTSS